MTTRTHPCVDCPVCGGCNCEDWIHCCGLYDNRTATAGLSAYYAAAANPAAVIVSPSRTVHNPRCGAVKAHMSFARHYVDSAPCPCLHGDRDSQAAMPSWSPWNIESAAVVEGYPCLMCTPAAVVTPPIRVKRVQVRLTGIGWPGDDGRCAKGRLPLHAKAGAR